MTNAPNGVRNRRHWSGLGAAATFAVLLFGSLFVVAGSAAADDCVWGQPGYRDCVDKLLAENRKKEAGEAASPGKASAAEDNATPGAVAANDAPAKKSSGKASTK